ncbi:oxygen-insensitive NAD(P)H nitroreductase [Paracoccus sp. Z330]|uniref:Oxygen-insensitive NAD(P)H nitroreductase n=1 Tax=Paracoccus onchidii TaxID=3017813 RepID=A0ABT4ZAC8_9RHOB|nr:oxygen-insensitive NAD(P)H nitroreductase [Paracoccus onchidii]MDB6176316.1 oxygen-insensitive NAD(P)H nitroreductase [Paracoccus onchidii]
MPKDIIDAGQTRYSTKVYDPSRKISDDDMTKLRELLRLSPSSVNLQPWYFVIAETDGGKSRVAKATDQAFPFNSPKITQASHVVVFATRIDADDAFLDDLLDQEARDGRFDADPEQFRADMDRGRRMFIDIHRSQLKDLRHWMDKQTYLNMGQLLIGAATLGIDATPMEGVDTAVLDREFGLTDKGYAAVAVVSLGYHADSDFNADLPKSRLAQDRILETV